MPGRGSLSRRKRHQTDKSSGQQLPRERRPSLDSSRCTCRPLASSELHQPCLPQGSGLDWLLSPRAHDKRASHRGRVVVVVFRREGKGGVGWRGPFRPKAFFSQFENSSLNSELNFQIDTCVFFCFSVFFVFYLFFHLFFFVFFFLVFFFLVFFFGGCFFVLFFFSVFFFPSFFSSRSFSLLLVILHFWVIFSFFDHFHFLVIFIFWSLSFFGHWSGETYKFSIFSIFTLGVRHQI